MQKSTLPPLIGSSSVGEKLPSPEQFGSGEGNALPESTLILLKLHERLGRILQEACDLHKQVGHLLATVTTQPA